MVNLNPFWRSWVFFAFQVILEWVFFELHEVVLQLHGGSYKTYETILWLACIQLAMFCLLLWVLMPWYLSAGEAWTSLQKICMFLFKLHFSSVFFLVNSKKNDFRIGSGAYPKKRRFPEWGGWGGLGLLGARSREVWPIHFKWYIYCWQFGFNFGYTWLMYRIYLYIYFTH